MLCDVIHDARGADRLHRRDPPGERARAPTAPRTSSTPSASPPARARPGMGVLVVFGGEIHHARCVRKTDTTSLTAFSSPQTGPLGRVTEGHPDDLVAAAAQPAARPAAPRQARLHRPDRRRRRRLAGPRRARHRARRRRDRHARRRPPGARAARAVGARPPSGSRSSPTAGPSAAWSSTRTYGYAGSEQDLRAHEDHPRRLPLAAGRAHEAARLPGVRALDRRGPLGVQPGRRLSRELTAVSEHVDCYNPRKEQT